MNTIPSSPIRLVTALAVALGVLVLAGPGCKGSKDIGQTCGMTKPCDAGSCDIEESKVSDPKIDYIALGSAECDDLACIRTSGSENPAHEGGMARGYCTAPCIEDSDCEPDFEGNGAMKCEQLLLDESFMEALKQNQPELYEQMFGSGASSKYCVNPRS